MFLHGFMSFAAICAIIACLLIMGSFVLIMMNLQHMITDLEQDEPAAYDYGSGTGE